MKLDFKWLTVSGLFFALCLSVLACGKTLSNTGTDSATHWLKRCSSDAECGSLECLCGVCTKTCTEAASCPNAALALCEAAPAASCGSAELVCSAECQTDADCSAVRSGLVCAANRCSTPEEAPGGGGNGGSGGSGGDDCSALPQCEFLCPEGTVNPVDADGCTHTCECVAPPPPDCTDEPGEPRDGCVPPAPDSGGRDCSSIPECEFLCPEGTVNPIDENGCTHSCECVNPGTPAGTASLFFTCGDPVCQGYTPNGSTPLCSTERAGDACQVEGTRCDPRDECNRLLICASTDPQLAPGGCPISRLRYKRDVHYLSDAELARYRDELLGMRLATWKYKHDPSKQHLGFMIDDNEQSAAVDPLRDMVDLYGYTSLAVATLQLQAREIEALRREIAELRAERASTPVTPAPAGESQRRNQR
jgi:hypothetical protein